MGCTSSNSSVSPLFQPAFLIKSSLQGVTCLLKPLFNQAVPAASPLFTLETKRQPRVTAGMFSSDVLHLAKVNTWRKNIISPPLFSSFFFHSPRARRRSWKAPWQQNLRNNLTRGHLLPIFPTNPLPPVCVSSLFIKFKVKPLVTP